MTYRFSLWFSAFALLACSPKSETDSDTQSSTSTSEGPSSEGSMSMGHSQTSATPGDTLTTSAGQTVTTASPSEPTTFDPETATATDGSNSDTVPGTVSTVTTGIESTFGTDFTTGISDTDFTTGKPCQDAPDQPHDSPCTDSSGCGCASSTCFVIPALGGFCSECLADTDCPDGGCTVPNPIVGLGAVCNLGQPGDGCESDAACNNPAAPHCSELFEVPGIITAATCGACDTDADCPPQTPHCTPDYKLNDFGGQKFCRAPGSVPNNSGCDFDGSGDQACASGFCGEASIMGLLKLGICGECNSDNDCDMGATCSDPAADLDTGALVGSVCM
ncbi:hypothetical protein [Nannocystis radixulma]|uniref:Uncharacterized protein n=1 Tax=Nannocystis radixulma TaxID=2995305 RepID=A0ABT5BJR4_9BACT|nr:hypothetical protein [Nannocystis radixulma]MDC0673784.1 hypothetical protein [Nannocystis radixulma]